ncbi:MAG: hypothetical protein OEN56_03090 [Gemmatimonadota bacterium]|nr:hypothetical protein [Gemmatimonadota bacterium]
MNTTKRVVALAICLGAGACGDAGLGVDLSGLWVASSYEYRSATGQVVDIIQRDGASMSMTVDYRGDGTRRASVLFNDGMGSSQNFTGDVDVEAGTFTFENSVFTFTRGESQLTMVDQSATFDFGSGPESATLTIRLTQL